MLKQLLDHPQFWTFVFLGWGIASDVLGASTRIKPNGVTQLIVSGVSKMLADLSRTK